MFKQKFKSDKARKRHENTEKAEVNRETQIAYPIQETSSDRYDSFTSATRSDSDLAYEDQDGEDNVIRCRNLDTPTRSNSSGHDSPVEEQPQAQSDIHNVPSLINSLNTEESQPQRFNNTASHVSEVTGESGLDNVSSAANVVLLSQPRSDNAASLNSLESQPQQQSGDVTSLNSSFSTESQTQQQSNDVDSPVTGVQPESISVASVGSPVEQHPQTKSNNASSLNSPATADKQPQLQSDDGASLNSPVQQQQSQSKSPYVKVTLPVDGTVIVSVTSLLGNPTSDDTSQSSNACKGTPVEQAIFTTTPVHSSNSNVGHDRAHDDCPVRNVDQVRRESVTVKLVFVGNMGTGKTSILKRIVDDKLPTSEQTTIIDFKYMEVTCNNTIYKLYLWDTAGQERFHKEGLGNVYLRGAVGAFVVYDVTEKESFDHCLEWKRHIDNVVQLENGDPIPIVLIANKVDLSSSDEFDGDKFSEENGFVGYFKTSAMTGEGIAEAIHFMVKKIDEFYCAHHQQLVSRNCATSVKLPVHFIKDDDKHKVDDKRKRKCC